MLGFRLQNTHRHRLPVPGELGHIVGLSTVNPKRRCIVSHFSLSDAADQRYSRGIHTVVVRFLDSGELARLASHWFSGGRRMNLIHAITRFVPRYGFTYEPSGQAVEVRLVRCQAASNVGGGYIDTVMLITPWADPAQNEEMTPTRFELVSRP
jgi:hypothetical protein